MTLPGPELAPLVKIITQPQLDLYCQASGDHNPLHWDAEFAAGTRFGGVIAHGMLTLAFISEMMAACLRAGMVGNRLFESPFQGRRLRGR